MTYLLARSDALRIPLADRSVDLVCGSPPYCDARTYSDGTLPEGHVVSRDARSWVSWMLRVTAESLRVSKGAVIWVAAGVTRDRTYWPACEGLMWRWFDEGWTERGPGTAADGSAYRPCCWRRNGLSGSGSDQWFRHDWEFAMCFKRPGKLPWADNVACGHAPKWKQGGEMTHRERNGKRINVVKIREGDAIRLQDYTVPDVANPGSVIVANVGGGRLGHELAHENEAPYPEAVPERFILSLCPPGGIVVDPFSGSGTTVAVAVRHERRGIGLDLRWSQADLAGRRIADSMRPVSRLDVKGYEPLLGQLNLF